MNRRNSYNSKERKEFGQAYQIFSEVENAGKTFAASKKKVKWLFGFANVQREFYVVLNHSAASGKKVVLENGNEITNSNSIGTEYQHGWQSIDCPGRIFRVEADFGLAADKVYNFSIDGVAFNRLPFKNELDDDLRKIANTSNEVPVRHENKRLSINLKPAEQKQKAPEQLLDVFGSEKTTSTFDPFADNGFSSSSSSAAPAVFDPFVNSTSSASTATKPVADQFAAKGASGASSTFDPFSENSDLAAFNSSSIATATTTIPAANVPNNVPASSNQPSLLDDPFSSQPQKRGSRRGSAQDIMMDFVGLSFDKKPEEAKAVSVETTDSEAVSIDSPKVESSKDLWYIAATKGLVDLDIVSKGGASNTNTVHTKRHSATLKDLLPSQTVRRSSMIKQQQLPPNLPVMNMNPQAINMNPQAMNMNSQYMGMAGYRPMNGDPAMIKGGMMNNNSTITGNPSAMMGNVGRPRIDLSPNKSNNGSAPKRSSIDDLSWNFAA